MNRPAEVGAGEAQPTGVLPWLQDAVDAAAGLGRAHALLVHGPSGAGHLELALLLAEHRLCESSAPQPCGQCASCRLVRTRSHPDLQIVVPDALREQLGWAADDDGDSRKSDAKPSRELRIGQVRQAIAWSQTSTARGGGKVLVLHPADALNATAANALLKTLEEPPGSLQIVLTSVDPDRLLPTVRSRCQRVRLSLPARDVARSWLSEHGVQDAPALLALAGSSPLTALELAREGIDAAWRAEFGRRVAGGDAQPLHGRPVPRVVEMLAKLAHDALAVRSGAEPRYFPSGSVPPAGDLAEWTAWVDRLLEVSRHEGHAWNAALLVEALVAQGRRVWSGPPAASGSPR